MTITKGRNIDVLYIKILKSAQNAHLGVGISSMKVTNKVILKMH